MPRPATSPLIPFKVPLAAMFDLPLFMLKLSRSISLLLKWPSRFSMRFLSGKNGVIRFALARAMVPSASHSLKTFIIEESTVK